METNELKAITEGLLFASGNEGLTVKQLARILNVSNQTADHLLEELKNEYHNPNRGIQLMQSHGIFQLTTKSEHSPYLETLLETPQSTRMSQAALETLAIVAYKQPITRTEIEDIRGVKSDRPVQTLLSRSLIEETGRKEGAGRPILFSTTRDFLTYFGLTSLEELPPLPEDVNASQLEEEADLFFDQFSEQMEDK
ncbi:segregation and condensation protein B [Lentibacillus persicus]|uniref:Segregation and condensation protein B n=1 Tax=Lentibacillus persicus TaxID=640948 RepID=A0A1I1SY04_9BACI|nr:SMC-Scp complex subunit ScpB [Lentibacillus persicus]SFD51339.1 segregation and condensation protein B [Lentibacillus persicus]